MRFKNDYFGMPSKNIPVQFNNSGSSGQQFMDMLEGKTKHKSLGTANFIRWKSKNKAYR